MSYIKNYIAELIGTAFLVILGCGTAMAVGVDNTGAGYVLTALAFGIGYVAASYSVGRVSGGHMNPAVSLGVYINGGLSSQALFGYFISQFLGAGAGMVILAAVFAASGIVDATGNYAANTVAALNNSIISAVIIELVLTFILVLVFLFTEADRNLRGRSAGLVVGLTYTVLHIIGIRFTGTGINPARSLVSAIAAVIAGNQAPIAAIWVFIVAPFAGAALAAVVYRLLSGVNRRMADKEIEESEEIEELEEIEEFEEIEELNEIDDTEEYETEEEGHE